MVQDLQKPVYWFSLDTPKALANFSPGLFQPWDQVNTINTNAESVRKKLRKQFANAFSVGSVAVIVYLGLEQPRAEISQRLRRIQTAPVQKPGWCPN